MFKLFVINNTEIDISKYVIDMTWSGDTSQAARKLNFTIAYNPYDKDFRKCTLELGNTIRLVYVNDKNKSTTIFEGKTWMMDRKTEGYTLEYVAYDKVIFLAKSKMMAKYENATVADIVKNVCSNLGVTCGNLHSDLTSNTINFVADNMSGTEIINKALEELKIKTMHGYHIVLINNALDVVRNDETVEAFNIKAGYNLISASHSASIENMVNKVQIINKDGTVQGYVGNDEDSNKYGTVQAVYKVDEKKDTQLGAKELLKSVEYNTSIEAVGNIQCISGYAINLVAKDESINAKFRIINDSHKISNNQHQMSLTVEFVENLKEGGGEK